MNMMGLNTNLVIQNSTRGDAIYRDAYIRGLALCSAQDVQQNTCSLDSNGTATWISSIINSIDSDGSGSWSLYMKDSKTSLNLSNTVPQIFVTTSETTFASNSTVISGTLEVKNYACFTDDVDIPVGNMTVGKNLTVDGAVAVGNAVVVTGGMYMSTLGANMLDFSQEWRIVYDGTEGGLVFQQNVLGTYTNRFIFNSGGMVQV